MPDPTKVPNDEFLEELKGYVDEIPEGLAGAFALNDETEPFAVIMGKEAWNKVVAQVNDLEDRLASAAETVEILQDQDTLDAIAEGLASLSDEDLADAFIDSVSPGVKNLIDAADTFADRDGEAYMPFPEASYLVKAQPFRQIGEGEYLDMQRRIKNQRNDNKIMTTKYAEVAAELADLKVRFDFLEQSHTYFAGQAEYYRHEYDKLVGAVNAVRAIHIEEL